MKMTSLCDFCGNEHFHCIEWHSKRTVICCRGCAENVLPMMIADSLVLADSSIYHAADKEWNGRFKVRFLRALLSRCQPRGIAR
jgi:hypothetical protein